MRSRIGISVFIALVFTGIGTRASAQVPGNPFSIDGTVTDFDNSGVSGGYTVPPCDPPALGADPTTGNAPQACKQIDENGNTQELGPINSDSTKIGVIHNAHLKTSGKGQGGVDCTVANPCLVSMLGTTNPNANVDLNAAWIQSAVANVNGVPHVFLYFAWRRDSSNGSGFISLEIEKSQAGGPLDNCDYDDAEFDPDLCNPWGGRQTGDVVFLWDQQGGTKTDIVAATFSGPAGFNQTLNFPDCSHTEDCALLSVQNVAQAVFGSNCGTGFVAGQCGEMVVDLTALGVLPASPTQCIGIGNIIPGTVTGNSNTADYKDVILAPFPRISNCGAISVTKVTVAPDGTTRVIDTTTTFGYTIARSGGAAVRFANDVANHTEDGPAPQVQIVRPNSFPAGGAGQPGLLGCAAASPSPCGGTVLTHTDLIGGTNYTLVETGPPVPWVKLSIICTVDGAKFDVTLSGNFDVRVDKTTSCVITNKLQLGSPAATSRQRAKVADKITISDITAGGSSLAAPALPRDQVRLTLYTGQCGSGGTEVANYVLNLTLGAPSGGKQSGTTDFNVDYVVETDATLYWGIQWYGDTFNNPVTLTQSCSSPGEIVVIDFTPNQSATP